jgi:hypothetical protein
VSTIARQCVSAACVFLSWGMRPAGAGPFLQVQVQVLRRLALSVAVVGFCCVCVWVGGWGGGNIMVWFCMWWAVRDWCHWVPQGLAARVCAAVCG